MLWCRVLLGRNFLLKRFNFLVQVPISEIAKTIWLLLSRLACGAPDERQMSTKVRGNVANSLYVILQVSLAVHSHIILQPVPESARPGVDLHLSQIYIAK